MKNFRYIDLKEYLENFKKENLKKKYPFFYLNLYCFFEYEIFGNQEKNWKKLDSDYIENISISKDTYQENIFFNKDIYFIFNKLTKNENKIEIKEIKLFFKKDINKSEKSNNLYNNLNFIFFSINSLLIRNIKNITPSKNIYFSEFNLDQFDGFESYDYNKNHDETSSTEWDPIKSNYDEEENSKAEWIAKNINCFFGDVLKRITDFKKHIMYSSENKDLKLKIIVTEELKKLIEFEEDFDSFYMKRDFINFLKNNDIEYIYNKEYIDNNLQYDFIFIAVNENKKIPFEAKVNKKLILKDIEEEKNKLFYTLEINFNNFKYSEEFIWIINRKL